VDGKMRERRKYNTRSMMTVTATTEAASRNQIGQPAAWISANKIRSPGVIHKFAADCIRFTAHGQADTRGESSKPWAETAEVLPEFSFCAFLRNRLLSKYLYT
jgi:hypothetical protein